MWVFMSSSYLSIVQHTEQPDCLLVRARSEGDIENVFPEATVAKTPEHDYLYRAVLPKERVAQAVCDAVLNIAYPNFKDSVLEDDRHESYFDVWAAMFAYQRRLDLDDRGPYRVADSLTSPLY